MKSNPDRSFTCELVTTWHGALACADLWRAKDMDLRDAVLQKSPLRDVGYASLFTYMYRRFGIPPLAGDDYKDLCGGWMLSTPSPKLIVLVRPSLSGPGFSFTPAYLRTPVEADALHIRQLNLPAETVAELKSAYATMLMDLLRPVGVRDQHFNALGDVAEDSPLMRCDRNGELRHEAKRHASAGFGVPPGLVGCTSWPALCGLINRVGHGDAAAGCAAIVDLLRAPTAREVLNLPRAVQRLVLMGLEAERVSLDHLIEWDDAQRADIAREIATLMGSAPGADEAQGEAARQNEQLHAALTEECTDEVVAAACGVLEQMSISTRNVKNYVASSRRQLAINVAWRELELCGEGAFPYDVIRLHGNGWQVDTQAIRSAFDEAGHPEIAKWVERTIARPFGVDAIDEILRHLQAKTEATESMKA